AWDDRGFRAGRARPRRPRGDEAPQRGLSLPSGPPWAMAPVRVDGHVTAVVLVARGRPLGAVARELAPWLAAGLAVLLLAGTALASLAVFRPAQHRLRDLEEAARRFGEGDVAARASEAGGDEVASVARAFNRMASEAAAREAALVDADRARRQLLADVTHELRTPLTAIRGYAETLTLPAFAPASVQGQQAVHVVDVEAQRLERLVNDLLDLARFDAGGAPLELGDVPVSALFMRVVERHGPAATTAQLTLDTTIASDVETVRGDERRLEQVLQNLTANALRHTPPGGRVSLAATREGESVVFAVRDTGSGIDAAHLPYVFDRFYKADTARAEAGGTGLGLSIVKAIVERHGGAVRVTSTPGVETCFTVRLPA
ncbi:MAG: HAMP domain-containing sensor histidine kinase, partial [Acidobacteriota bacterium]